MLHMDANMYHTNRQAYRAGSRSLNTLCTPSRMRWHAHAQMHTPIGRRFTPGQLEGSTSLRVHHVPHRHHTQQWRSHEAQYRPAQPELLLRCVQRSCCDVGVNNLVDMRVDVHALPSRLIKPAAAMLVVMPLLLLLPQVPAHEVDPACMQKRDRVRRAQTRSLSAQILSPGPQLGLWPERTSNCYTSTRHPPTRSKVRACVRFAACASGAWGAHACEHTCLRQHGGTWGPCQLCRAAAMRTNKSRISVAADKAISRHRCPCLFVRQVSLAPPNSQPLASPPHLPHRTLLPRPPLAAQFAHLPEPSFLATNHECEHGIHQPSTPQVWKGCMGWLQSPVRRSRTDLARRGARQRKLRAQGYGRRASCGIAALPC